MAEEFQGGTWWDMPSRGAFGGAGSMLCSMGSGDFMLGPTSGCYGGGWYGNHNKSTTTDHSSSDYHGYGQTGQRQQTTDSDSGGSSTDNVFMDSTLQMIELGLSSSSSTSITDWNANLMLNNMESSEEHQTEKDHSSSCDEYSTLCSSTTTGNYGYPEAASIIESLFEPDEQSMFNNNQSMTYNNNNNNNNNNQILPTTSSWANNNNKVDCFWNATALNENIRVNFLPNCPSPIIATKANINEEPIARGMDVGVKKASNEPQFKRPRIETPSPLPTFKVRKEKLGDRITAIQQLVSPFGKTDTASVLHEAIEYIKFLHDQVNVLSTAYMKNGGPAQYNQQCVDHKFKDQEVAKQDLKSRGLCLVPISSTFPVANETTPEFWTPTFGGSTFR